MKRLRAAMHHAVDEPHLDAQPVLKRRELSTILWASGRCTTMVFFHFAHAFLAPFWDRN
jgi:hypothetical protein